MAAMAGLISHLQTAGNSLTAGQALTGKSAGPMAAPASGTSSTGSSGSSSATISANDFLTLLVTEMQNQDPTATTDPNEYINQLVQVNSLEQLIDINQNLSSVLGTSGAAPSGSPSQGSTSQGDTSQGGTAKSSVTEPNVAGANGSTGSATAAGVVAAHKPGAAGSRVPGSNTVAAINQFAQSVSQKRAPGNLSVPAAQPAAHHVARALDGHSHTPANPGKHPVSQ